MSNRIDYLDDPNAPRPNSIVPAASAVVVSDDGAILLQRRRDNNMWALPGGTMELGESIHQTATREVLEETGLNVKITGLVGVYTNPKHVIQYEDGEVRQEFNIAFTAAITGGRLMASAESWKLEFVMPGELDRYPMHPSTRQRIDDYLDQRSWRPR